MPETGETVTWSEPTVSVALPLRLVLAVLVAVIVTCGGLGTVVGGRYCPELLIVPTVEFPPPDTASAPSHSAGRQVLRAAIGECTRGSELLSGPECDQWVGGGQRDRG